MKKWTNTWNSKGASAAANTVLTIYPDGLSVREKTVIEYLLWRKIKAKEIAWEMIYSSVPTAHQLKAHSTGTSKLAHFADRSLLLPCARFAFPRHHTERALLKAFNSFLFSLCLIKISPQPIDLSNPVLFLIISPNASFNFHSVTTIGHPYNSPEFHFVVYNFLSNTVGKLNSATCFYTVVEEWLLSFQYLKKVKRRLMLYDSWKWYKMQNSKSIKF